MNKRIEFHTKAHYYLAMLIAFSLPIARLTPIFIALLLLNWLVEADFKNKFQIIFKNKFALLFITFYLLHIIGLLYTENIHAGLFDIQVKFSLLVFPIILASRPMPENKIKFLFISLIAGCITAEFTMLTRAIYNHYTLGSNDFYYEAFSSFLIHPSYISMYVNVALCWIIINLINKLKQFSISSSIFLVLLFTLFVILLSSKMGLITMILVYFSFLVYYVISNKKYLLGILGIAGIIILISSVMLYVPELSGRIRSAIEATTNSSSDQAESESTAVRLLIWKASNQVISEHPLIGQGTGDAKDALMNEYQKRGMTGALEHKLNAHNEYYQVFISLGLIGFMLLLIHLFAPLSFAFKTSNAIYISFLLIIALNFIPESMLETQAGVMFYSFFNSLLCFQKNKLITI